MRVAVTVEQSWHRVPGGTAWSVLELLRALGRRADLAVVGVAARHQHPAPEGWRPPVVTRHLTLPRLALYEAWHLPVGRFPRVERATGRVDVVHASTLAYPATAAPVVATVHDLAFLDDAGVATRHGLRFSRRGLDLARRHAALVVCPSEATRRDCLRAGIDDARLRVVPWGVDAEPATAADIERARARHGLDRPYVLFCGTVEPRKNLPALLQAFAGLERPDTDLVLVGPDGWNEDIGPAVARLGPRVRPLGFRPRSELLALLAGAAVVCYPSRREGFGLPVLEAMAQGAPVVTSRGTATEEVAGKAAVLVDPADVGSIAAGLKRVLDDDRLARELSERGRARAASYTWERAAERYAAVYAEAAVAGGAP
ncbi:MAG: glycosyltransferase family 1 protein [Acidimicrobiales bacterium]